MGTVRELSDHVILLGWNAFSRMIVEELLSSSNDVVVVGTTEGELEDINATFGDDVTAVCDTLESVNGLADYAPADARAVFLNLPTDEQNLVVVVKMQRLFDDVEYVVVLKNEDLKQTFRSAGVTWPLSRFEITSKVIASLLYEPDVADLMLELLAATRGTGNYDIQQYLIGAKNAWGDRTFGEAFEHFKSEYNIVPIAVAQLQPDDSYRQLQLPPPNTPLHAGDYLIVVTSHASEPALRREFRTREGRSTQMGD